MSHSQLPMEVTNGMKERRSTLKIPKLRGGANRGNEANVGKNSMGKAKPDILQKKTHRESVGGKGESYTSGYSP